MDIHLKKLYQKLLASYISSKKEDHLYSVQQLSKWFLEKRIPPDEVVNMHVNAMKEQYPDMPDDLKASFDLLIEIMIGYGISYREKEKLVNRHRELENEIEVAVGMQQTLLPDGPPKLGGVDIGVVSVAAKQMSGDYYNFVDHGSGSLGIAIADIIGKGIPAALCMSMIKYAMDRLDDQPSAPLSPSQVLRDLNTVVERNVDPSMFITMVYGVYDSLNHHFRYATAGHEPGLYYCHETGEFVDLETKGLVLGVSREVRYPEYKIQLSPQDAIILFSDGVTECKVDGQFIERDMLKEIIRTHIHLPAQESVETIHQALYDMCGYKIRDDQTIVILKRDADEMDTGDPEQKEVVGE